MLTRSTLPVRSPLPNRQPSIRSAPAIRASSPAAVPVPRSLCGCTDNTMLSRRARLRCIHSIMSAKMLGVEYSTVDGRLMMHLCVGVGCQTSVTASTTRLANASSVPEKCSGEYWKVHCVSRWRAASCWISRAFSTAKLHDLVFVHAQRHPAHDRRGGVVDMHDGALGARQRFERALDQMRARLRQHLDRDVVRHQVLVDQLAHEIELHLRGRRETRPRSP